MKNNGGGCFQFRNGRPILYEFCCQTESRKSRKTKLYRTVMVRVNVEYERSFCVRLDTTACDLTTALPRKSL